jgi:phosphatidylglycerophosphatase A
MATLLASFALFRLFDIAKPYPIGRLETLPGSSGIMADDMLAGIYANLVLQGLVWAFPAWWGVS